MCKTYSKILVLCIAMMLGSASVAQPAAVRPTVNDPWPGMKKLLVVADVQTGFHHDSINHAMGVIEQLGRESGLWATVIRTDSQLVTKKQIRGTGARYEGRGVNARNLDFFDGIFILTSGATEMDEEQKEALLSFVRDDGKGIVLGHAASVAYFDWPEFHEMAGAFMKSEYRVDTFPLIRESTSFPGADAFPTRFTYRDQFAVMEEPFSSKDAEVILRLDTSGMSDEQLAQRSDKDFPIVWAKNYGKGRVFNQTIGHLDEVWDDPKFRTLMTEAIAWSLGLRDYQLTYREAKKHQRVSR